MGIKWFCDASGKEIFMAPPYKVKLDDKGLPIKKKIKTMNAAGDLEHIETHEVSYEQPKAYIIRLSVGDEVIQRVVCEDELNKIKLSLKQAWDILEGLKK